MTTESARLLHELCCRVESAVHAAEQGDREAARRAIIEVVKFFDQFAEGERLPEECLRGLLGVLRFAGGRAKLCIRLERDGELWASDVDVVLGSEKSEQVSLELPFRSVGTAWLLRFLEELTSLDVLSFDKSCGCSVYIESAVSSKEEYLRYSICARLLRDGVLRRELVEIKATLLPRASPPRAELQVLFWGWPCYRLAREYRDEELPPLDRFEDLLGLAVLLVTMCENVEVDIDVPPCCSSCRWAVLSIRSGDRYIHVARAPYLNKYYYEARPGRDAESVLAADVNAVLTRIVPTLRRAVPNTALSVKARITWTSIEITCEKPRTTFGTVLTF